MISSRTLCTVGLSLLVLVGLSLNAPAVELAVNGGFETGDFTGWTQFPTGPGQQTIDNVNPSSGTYSARSPTTSTPATHS